MLKSLTRLWLSGMQQAATVQRSQQKRLLKSLLPKPPKKARSTVKAAPKPRARPTAPSVPAAPVAPAASSAPGARLPGKWMAFHYSSLSDAGTLPARRMQYWLYLPSSLPAGPFPMVVMLHGCEQTAAQFAQGTRMNALAEEKGFAVVYPQQSLRGHTHRCWHWYERSTQDGGDDVRLIAGIIDKVCARYPVDRSRVYAAGISAGAGMAHILALCHPDKIAAVGLHSGPVYGGGHSRTGAYGVMQLGAAHLADQAIRGLMQKGVLSSMPAILVHGHEDRVVRRVNQDQLALQFRVLNGLGPGTAAPEVDKPARTGAHPSHAYRLKDFRHGRKLLLRVCEVQQLEHAWSGGDCSLKYNACPGPDASRMMWDFFERHRR